MLSGGPVLQTAYNIYPFSQGNDVKVNGGALRRRVSRREVDTRILIRMCPSCWLPSREPHQLAGKIRSQRL